MGTKGQIAIDSKEVAVEKFPWGEIRWLWNSNINLDAEQTFGIVRINPGERNMAHIHSNCEELLYVVSGECDHGVGDNVYHLKEGMLICIPEGMDHYAMNTGDGLFEAIISYSSPERQMKGVEG